jgi:PBSX family phage terminase large subunit
LGIYSGELTFHEALETLDRMPKQKEFISAPERNAAFVGGVGSSKTVGLVVSAILNMANDPGGFSLMGRLNMNSLETSTMKTFLEMIPEEYGNKAAGANGWADTKKTYTMSNGHQLIFRHLDITDPKVAGHIKSMNLSAAYVDEATEISEETFFLLAGRLRRKTAPRHLIRLSSNPAGHDWVWRHFFDPQRKESWKKNNRGITASSMDNPFLPEEYIENLVNLYPQDWADRFIHGHFSDFTDLVYKEFTEDSHVWDARRCHAIFGGLPEPPATWPVIVGMDIGSDVDPWAVCLIAVAPNGMLFQFAEVYGTSLLIRTIAAELKQKLGGRNIEGLAYDYANRQAALELAEYDINGYPAIKEVRPGLFKCAQYMHIDPRLEHPFNPKIKGAPRFYMSSECLHARRETSGYKWGKDRSGNLSGEPSHENSHSPDGIRYAIHSFRPLPERLETPKLWENPALDALSREYWRDQERLRDKMATFKGGNQQLTMKEWAEKASRGPIRFQKPANLRFQRVGRS